MLETPLNNKGKRKAEDVDLTPPDQRTGHHTTFVIPTDGRRESSSLSSSVHVCRAHRLPAGLHHVSEVSKPPSSYHGRKRARLSTSGASPSASPAHSRPGSTQPHLTDSWSSRTGAPFLGLHRATSKTASSTRSGRPESMSTNAQRRAPSLAQSQSQSRGDRRRSVSEISFPISALVAPHAPSMSIRSGGYYMRDPRKPPRIRPTSWSLHLPSVEEQGSPTHAWLFFIGFVLFPLWWFASFWRIPPTRVVGGTDTEKAVALDDPQVEHGECFRVLLRCAVRLRQPRPFVFVRQMRGPGGAGAGSCQPSRSSPTSRSSSWSPSSSRATDAVEARAGARIRLPRVPAPLAVLVCVRSRSHPLAVIASHSRLLSGSWSTIVIPFLSILLRSEHSWLTLARSPLVGLCATRAVRLLYTSVVDVLCSRYQYIISKPQIIPAVKLLDCLTGCTHALRCGSSEIRTPGEQSAILVGGDEEYLRGLINGKRYILSR